MSEGGEPPGVLDVEADDEPFAKAEDVADPLVQVADDLLHLDRSLAALAALDG